MCVEGRGVEGVILLNFHSFSSEKDVRPLGCPELVGSRAVGVRTRRDRRVVLAWSNPRH